jgi:hypothetical protein
MHLRPYHAGADRHGGAAGDLAEKAEAVAAGSGDLQGAHRPAAADAHRARHGITMSAAASRALRAKQTAPRAPGVHSPPIAAQAGGTIR